MAQDDAAAALAGMYGIGAAAGPVQDPAKTRRPPPVTAHDAGPVGLGSVAAGVDMRDYQPVTGLGRVAMAPAAAPQEAAVEPAPAGPVERPVSMAEQLAANAYDDEARFYALANAAQGSKPNVAYPFAQEQAQFVEGVPFDKGSFEDWYQPLAELPPMEPGESEFEYQARIDALQQADMEQQRDEYDNTTGLALDDPRKIGTAEGPGLGEAQRQAQETLDEAQIAGQERVATLLRDTAQAQAQATAEMRARDEERRARAQQELDAMEALQDVEQQARARVQALPELDDRRYFKSMSGKNKFWALVGLIGGGLAGIDVAGQLMSFAQQDLEAQKANASQTFDQAAAAEGAVAQQTSLYQELLRAAGDERLADLTLLNAQYEDAMRMLDAEIASTQVPELRAQLQQGRVALEEQIRAQSMEARKIAAMTPDRVLTGGAAAARYRKRAEEARKRGDQMVDVLVGRETKTGEELLQQAGRVELEGVKARGAAEAKRVEKDADREMKIKERTAELGAVETSIGDFLAKNEGNIHGRGWVWTGESDQRIETDSFLTALKEQVTKAYTGASATPEQQEAFGRLVEGDWSEISDDALRARLRALQGLVASQREYLQRDLPSERPRVTNTRELTTFQPE